MERKIISKKKCVDQEETMKVGEVGVHVLNLAPEVFENLNILLIICSLVKKNFFL